MVLNLNKYFQFIKFAFVAAAYNLFAYFIYAALIYLHCHYLLASFISYVSGVILSYFMNKTLVFQYHQRHWKIMARYIGFYLMLLAVNLSLLHSFIQILKINPYLAQLFVIVISMLVSYNAMRIFVFRSK